MRRAALLATASVLVPTAAAAQEPGGPSYRGEYANAFMAGRTEDGRRLTVLAGTHTHFPYADSGSTYDQVAVRLAGKEPLVVTGRPRLEGLRIALEDDSARFRVEARGVALRLLLRAVRHTRRYEGDPGQLGDLFIGMGYEGENSPGLVYTPYELTALERGSVTVRGERVRLAALHGQAEVGHLDAPTDPRFRSAFDYAAAPTLAAGGDGYTFVGFAARALHAGLDGSLDAYFRATGSDELTMADGELTDGNPHGVPAPFDNRGPLPERSRKLAQWAVDLGPGVLYRKLVRMRDAAGRRLEALTETIVEDDGDGPDAAAPEIAAARARGRRIVFRLSEPALVGVAARGRWRLLGEGRIGPNAFRARLPRSPLRLRATDEAGNRSRAVEVVVRR